MTTELKGNFATSALCVVKPTASGEYYSKLRIDTKVNRAKVDLHYGPGDDSVGVAANGPNGGPKLLPWDSFDASTGQDRFAASGIGLSPAYSNIDVIVATNGQQVQKTTIDWHTINDCEPRSPAP